MSNYSRHKQVLLSQTAGATADVTSPGLIVRSNNSDAIPDFRQTFTAIFNSTMAGGSGTPNITPKLQTSWDGTNWMDLVTGTALTADGSLIEQKEFTARMGPFVRVVTSVTTSTYTGEVTLVANAAFTVALA